MNMHMQETGTTLEALVSAARDAGPWDRIAWRDCIAAHGDAAIREMEPWLEDARLGAFAVRVIERAALVGDAYMAREVLRRARPRVASVVRQDIDVVLRQLRARVAPAGPDKDPARPVRRSHLARS